MKFGAIDLMRFFRRCFQHRSSAIRIERYIAHGSI